MNIKMKEKKIINLVDNVRKISEFDYWYSRYVNAILKYGYHIKNRTSVDTSVMFGINFYLNLDTLPILISKEIKLKSIIHEMIWMYFKGDNSLDYLHDNGIHFWDKWDIGDGTIGNTYGYIIKKYDQINKVINQIKEDPTDRRIIINLWDNEEIEKINKDLKEGNKTALPPCIDFIIFNVANNKLHVSVMQRSGDMALGVPFDITEIAILTSVIAKLTNLKPGKMSYHIANAHIYDNSVDGVTQTLMNTVRLGDSIKYRNSKLKLFKTNPSNKYCDKILDDYKPVRLNLDKINTIDDVKYENIIVENYKGKHFPFIKMDVVE